MNANALQLQERIRLATSPQVLSDVQQTALDTLTKRLIERRIGPEVIATFEIEPHRNGWVYPTPGSGLRWKNHDSNATPKYQWLDNKSEPAHALYYAADLREQIASNGGVCWYVSGEPDVWAMRSAGIPHAISAFTEKTLAPYLVDFLRDLGVMLLCIAPDLDKTGADFAGKMAAALKGTGIELDCRRLPVELGERGDIGKAWQKYTSRIPFERYLLGLPRWYPEPEKPKIETPLVVSVGEYGDVPVEYRQKVMDACDVTKIGGNGFSNMVKCPIHKEDTPSAHFHEIKGLYCFHEMKYYKWVEVGAALGLGTFTNKPTEATVINSTQLAVEAQAELVRLGMTSLARLLDALYTQGYRGGEVLTVKELVKAVSSNVTAWTVRVAIAQAEGKDYEKRTDKRRNTRKAREAFCGYFPPLFFQHNEVEKTHKKVGHRQAKRIRVPKMSEVYAVLKVEPGTIQTIPGAYMRHSAQYRAEIMAAKIRRASGEYAKKQLAEPVGISTRTVQTYCKRANIEVTPKFDKHMMTETEIQALPKDAQELGEWRREGRIKGAVWLETLDGKRFAPTQEGAAMAGQNGRAFRYVRQLANHYKSAE